MKLCVLANLYGAKTLDETLARLKSLGVEAVEIGAGGYPGKAHCDPAALLADEAKFNEFKATIDKYGIEVAALACHGNPVHPDKATAKMYDEDFKNAVLLAEKIGVDTIITFSGCPGDCDTAKSPNWVTCPWPDDFLKVLDYQWNEVLIPYWKETVKFANAHGVTKIALEMHPGFCVYNPETLLRLREAVGDTIGANFDPSHLIWQGMDPVAAIRALEGAIYHVHAKDTKIDPYNTAKFGVLDTKHYSDEIHRSWVFRTVGYGNGLQYWRDLISNLRLVGYDKVMSIEHEDSLMSIDEGLEKAVAFLKESIISEPKPGTMSWA
ncbi:MAG: sugar phosphate isomerase/epimerase [Ruminococcaceae bacterium]|nr:sugar phosphate isomerase/epimerase [Oscillospiraceae bacterium]MBQ9691975.1 sugar phosphate isomerase/epimerase [Clostridia bacterium]